MEEKLELLEHPDMELLFNHLNRAAIILDAQSRVVYLNPSAERLFSISLTIAKDKPFSDLIRRGKACLDLVAEAFRTGRTLKAHETEIFSPQGPLHLEIEVAPMGIPEKLIGVLLLMDELSVVQALREESRVLDRLSMMGTLASGLAHEIRNPLGGIKAAAEMMLREETLEEKKEYLTMILSEVDRVNHLVTQLLNFAKPKKVRKEGLNINQLLSELLILQEPAMRKCGIVLKQEFDPSLPPVEGHKSSLKQAFLNLIKNALEAMEGGGVLTISTSYNTDYRMQVGEGRAHPMALITVKDSGTGISPEEMNSLFTPFFTTKANGTGLGLMMTQRILREHEGILRVISEKKKGSSFKVLLKLAVQ